MIGLEGAALLFAGALLFDGVISGVAIALAVGARDTTKRIARREVADAIEHNLRWWKAGVDVRLGDVQAEAKVTHEALEEHGLMRGRRVVPRLDPLEDGVVIEEVQSGR